MLSNCIQIDSCDKVRCVFVISFLFPRNFTLIYLVSSLLHITETTPLVFWPIIYWISSSLHITQTIPLVLWLSETCPTHLPARFPPTGRQFPNRPRHEQTLAVAMDLQSAYNRVHFKPLMDMFLQYRETLTRWTAAALWRTMVMQLGSWSSAPHQLTVGGEWACLSLSLILNSVYTNGLENLNQNRLSRAFTLAHEQSLQVTSTRQPK